ncbi:lantibiotic dehydratase [Spirosoma linguale]|uniref:Lantibiotic dehydratase domain protein n=1 Tax=Spirosoma linguale (strain ATCC 33905 / DSM 74 / LMG 10896 / Claus 1) TaxID=504472 RepID=D2QKQ0_SPILD|nr:Lantibiotic dehydratase domain protein [Spirosoma linguale DSM 74]
MIYLFPYLICRVGGESIDLIQSQQSQVLNDLFNKIISLHADCQEQKQVISIDLLAYLQTQEGVWQKQVHNFRRNLYNDRPIKTEVEAALIGRLSSDLKGKIYTYRETQNIAINSWQLWEETYQNSLMAHRSYLQTLACNETLKQGLALSSPDLVANLDSFTHATPKLFRKRENNTEQSLLKYLTRMVTKTSPFSTFTNIALGRLYDKTNLLYKLEYDHELQIIGHVRLNNHIYKALRDLIWAYKPIFAYVNLRPNPTLRQVSEESQWIYLTNVNNVESFQRLPIQQVPNAVLEILQQEPKLTFGKLMELLGELVDADPDAIETYLRQLIEIGFIELVWPSSGLDPDWDKILILWLDKLATENVPMAMELVQGLNDLRGWANQFSTASSTVRMRILAQAHNNFRALFWDIHKAAGLPVEERRTPEEISNAYREAKREPVNTRLQVGQDVKLKVEKDNEYNLEETDGIFRYQASTVFRLLPKQLFYEDTTTSIEASLSISGLKNWTEQLEKISNFLHGISSLENEQQQMLNFFKSYYPNKLSVPLLTFYEDYYRIVQMPAQVEIRRKNHEKANAISNTKVNDIDRISENVPESINVKGKSILNIINENIYNFCLSQLQNQLLPTTIEMSEADLDSLLSIVTLPTPSRIKTESKAAFVQFFTEDNQLIGVVNSVLSGWGRMFSRFLHILDPDVLATQRIWNEQDADEVILLECVDASYFNANIHPPLMPYELQLPNGHTSLPIQQQIPVSDLHLQLVYNKLQLTHIPTGKPAFCFDLGFQSPTGRSPLFRLATQFTLPEYPSYQRLTSVANTVAAELQPNLGIQQFPRIIYNKQIILQRRYWRVSTKETPQRDPLETDAAYAYKLLQWQQRHKIPNQVFVTINESHSGYQPVGEQARKLTRDDYKPQYIDFTHPLLVLLFEKMMVKAPDSYRIVEMLPGINQMATVADKSLVSECLVQWYTNQPQ